MAGIILYEDSETLNFVLRQLLSQTKPKETDLEDAGPHLQSAFRSSSLYCLCHKRVDAGHIYRWPPDMDKFQAFGKNIR